MTILDQLVDELRAAAGPIRSSDLAHRIGVSESALSGMIDVLATKGVLTPPSDPIGSEPIACSGVACGTTCVGLDACPFIVDVPATYSLTVSRSAPLPKQERISD